MNVFEKIIERLGKVSELIRPVGWSRKVEVVEMKGIIQIIKEVEEEYNNGWIPLEEQLPKQGKYVLLSFENCTLPFIGRYEENENGEGNFHVGNEEESCISQDLFVNAWQPLPEPYEEYH